MMPAMDSCIYILTSLAYAAVMIPMGHILWTWLEVLDYDYP